MPETHIDWSACPLVEVDRDRMGGRPVLNGTRMPADDLIANFDSGVPPEKIAEQFRIAPATLRDLLSYAERHRIVALPLR